MLHFIVNANSGKRNGRKYADHDDFFIESRFLPKGLNGFVDLRDKAHGIRNGFPICGYGENCVRLGDFFYMPFFTSLSLHMAVYNIGP